MRARAAALAATATFAPASPGALAAIPPRVAPGECSATFTLRMFRRALDRVYASTGLPHRGAYGHLWRYARCERPPSTEARARAVWHRALVGWTARRNATRRLAAPELADGEWAIPVAIVMCESRGQNLPPNSAGASGYYQIIPSTWAAYGGPGPAAYLASKPEQDAVAGRIWDGGRGADQWVCKA